MDNEYFHLHSLNNILSVSEAIVKNNGHFIVKFDHVGTKFYLIETDIYTREKKQITTIEELEAYLNDN